MKKIYILIFTFFIFATINSVEINDILNNELKMNYEKAISQWIQYYNENQSDFKKYIAINRVYDLCKAHNVLYNDTKAFLKRQNSGYSNYFLYFLKKNKEGIADNTLLNSINIFTGFYILGPFDYSGLEDISELEKSGKDEYVGKHFNIREKYVKFPYPKIFLDDILGEDSYAKARLRSNLYVKKSGDYLIKFSFNDGILIKVDGQKVFEKNVLNTQGSFLYTLMLSLTKGYHKIEIFSGVENDIWSLQFSLDKKIVQLKDNEILKKKKGKLIKYEVSELAPQLKGSTQDDVVLQTLFYRYAKNFDSHERADYTEMKKYCDNNEFPWGYMILGQLENDRNNSLYWYEKLLNSHKELANYKLAQLFDNDNKLIAGYKYMKELNDKKEMNYDLIMDYYYGLHLNEKRQRYMGSLKDIQWYASTAEAVNEHIGTMKDVHEIEAYIEKISNEYPYKRLIYSNLLLQYYNDNDLLTKYISLEKEFLEIKPYSASDYINFADYLYKHGLKTQFLSLTKVIEGRFLYNTDLLNMLVDYYLSKSDLKNAETFAERYLRINPQNQNMLNIYSELSEKTNYAHEYFNKNSIDITQKPNLNDSEKDADLVVLSKRKLISESSNGRITKMFEVLYYINKYSGINKLNYLPVYYSSSSEYVKVENVRVIHANGNIFPQYKGFSYAVDSYDKTHSDFRKHYFSFENLNVGSKVYLKYSIIQYSQKSYRDEFPGDIEFIKTNFPIKRSQLILIYPKSKQLYFKEYHFNNIPKYKSQSGYNIYQWNFEYLKEIGYFTNMVPDVEALPFIVISNFKNWGDVYKWAYHLFKNRFKVNKKVQDLFSSLDIKKNDAFRTKVEKVFKYVSQDIHYFGVEYGLNGFQPRFPSKVISDKYGDCKDKATLMKVLLSLCGVKANITLVRTSDVGRMTSLPIITMFNHAVLTVYDEKGIPYIVDPTVNYGLPWEVPQGLYKAFALEFDKEGYRTKIITKDPGQENNEKFNTNVNIKSVSDVSFHRSIEKSGYFNFYTRSLLELGDKARQNLENYWRNFYSKVKVNALDFNKDKLYVKRVKYSYDFQIGDFINKHSMELHPLLVALDLFSDYGILRSIDYPISVGLLNHSEQVKISIDKVTGKFIKSSVPSNLAIDNKIFSAIIKYKLINKKLLEVEWNIKFKKDRVSVKEYKKFREDLLKLKSSFEETVGVEL